MKSLTLEANSKMKTVMWKGENLLAYEGDPDDYPEVGRFLAKKILTAEQMKDMCWFPAKIQLAKFGRTRVPSDAENCFKGCF